MYPDSGYKTTHAQSVCTRPFSRGEGPGDEARKLHHAGALFLSLLGFEGRTVHTAAIQI